MVELGDFLLKTRDKKLNLSPPEEMWNWKRGRWQSSVAVVFFREVACCSAATLLLPCCSAAAGKDNVKQVLSWNHSNTCFFAPIVRTVWLTKGITHDHWPSDHFHFHICWLLSINAFQWLIHLCLMSVDCKTLELSYQIPNWFTQLHFNNSRKQNAWGYFDKYILLKEQMTPGLHYMVKIRCLFNV